MKKSFDQVEDELEALLSGSGYRHVALLIDDNCSTYSLLIGSTDPKVLKIVINEALDNHISGNCSCRKHLRRCTE